jgi:hypothetical protein
MLDRRIFRRRILIGGGFLTGLLIFGRPIKTYLSKQTADIANQSIQDGEFKTRVSDNVNALLESSELQEKVVKLSEQIFISTITNESVQQEIGKMFVNVLKQPTVLDAIQNGLTISASGTVSDQEFQEQIKENITDIFRDTNFLNDCSESLRTIVKKAINPFS